MGKYVVVKTLWEIGGSNREKVLDLAVPNMAY